jgi:hypothetical protein
MPKLFGKGKDVAPEPSGIKSPMPKSDRELREQQRAERKAKREQRNKELSERSEAEESKKKAKSKPKLSREEQDAKDVKLGCCYHFTKFLAGAMHFIDFVLGLLSLIYGTLIYVKFKDPATEMAIACMTYGSVLVFTSCMGVFGFTYKCCNRCGLLGSIYVAPLITTYYFFLLIYFLSDNEALFSYLDEHKDVMYLTDERIAELKSLMPVVYSCLAGLAVAEMFR